MDERAIQIRVGMLIVATVAIGVLMLFLFGGFPNVLVGNYTVYVKFPQAPGVTPNTSVRKNGVKIGTVTNVELPDEGGVLVTLVIDGNRRLYVNEVCHISTGTLLGDAVIEFVPSGVRGEELKHGEYISGVVAGDPLKVLVSLEDNMTRALRSIEDAGGEVQQLARSMDQVLVTNRDQFQRVVQKSELALDSIRTTMENIDDFVGDDELRARLKKSLEELPEL
jgi:phospholipid/cholesterol/gamma-HCH transport system substrate-binding protein